MSAPNHERITNVAVSARTGLRDLADIIARRRQKVFGYIAWISDGVPAHDVLKLQVDLASRRPPGRD